MGRYGSHAGHNPKGKVASGAVGLIDESTENRNVNKEVISVLKSLKHTVYDCTCNDAVSVSDCVNKQVKKSNAQKLDLTCSIHFNSGAKDEKGNGKTTGVEVLVCTDRAKKEAEQICKNLEKLGFKNRGVKKTTRLGFLNKTVAPALLVEVCFVDDKDDVNLYKKLGAKKIGEAIAYGMLCKNIPTTPKPPANNSSSNTTNTSKELYRVVTNSYNVKENAEKEIEKLKKQGINAFIHIDK